MDDTARPDMLAAAHSYISLGLAVIPLHDVSAGHCSCWRGASCPPKQAGKHPLNDAWQNNALTSGADVQAVWEQRPAANIGIVTGERAAGGSGVWALDIDPAAGGASTMIAWERDHGRLPMTWRTRTGSGGLHYLWAQPDGMVLRNSAGRIGPGLDVRATGGYVVAPPSITARGAYTVETRTVFALAPAALLAAASRPEPPAQLPTNPVDNSRVFLDPATAGRAARYGQRAVAEEVQRLATALPGTRNETAFRVACRLVELANSGWAGIPLEIARQLYDRAASVHAGGSDPFTAAEAAEVWGKAGRHIGTRVVPVPDVVLAERTVMGLPPPFEPGRLAISARPAELEQRQVQVVAVAPIGQSHVQPATAGSAEQQLVEEREKSPLNLPAEFWESRPSLSLIRQAAHARGRSADAVFAGVLARIAALAPYGLTVDTGIGDSGVPLHMFVAAVAQSGGGKSTGLGIARALVPVPEGIDLREGPLGSGQGIAEAFYGVGERDDPEDMSAHPKRQKIRMQVRHNVLVDIDEGAGIRGLLEQKASVLGETLRSAWSGRTLGALNASAETTRTLAAGSYSLGLVAGFQPATVGFLLDDTDSGMAQRFLWVWIADDSIPEPDARPLWPAGAAITATLGYEPRSDLFAPLRPADGRRFTLPPEVTREIAVEDHRRAKGGLVPPHESQRPAMTIRLAAHLALIDGRRDINGQDWQLAQMIWDTNVAVQSHLKELARAERERSVAAHIQLQVRTEAELERARRAVGDDAHALGVTRVAQLLARKITEPVGKNEARKKYIASRDKILFEEAVAMAVELKMINEEITSAGHRLTPI